MKIQALSPQEAQEGRFDELQDIEVEATIAKINCIIARKYEPGAPVYIPFDTIEGGSLGVTHITFIVERFRQGGWKIGIKELFESANEVKIYYTFTAS